MYPEPVVRSIFYYIFESLKDTTLIILIVAAAVSLLFAIIAHEGKNGWLDSIGIFIAIFLVSTVTSFNNWTKEKQFRELNKIKEQRKVKVIRDGKHFEILISEVMVGDLVVLETGDQVPADGLYLF